MTNHDICCGSCGDFKPFHGDQFEVWSAGECDRTGNTLTEHDLSEMRCCWREKDEVSETDVHRQQREKEERNRRKNMNGKLKIGEGT